MTDFEFDQPKKEGVNLAAKPSRCRTCGGDRYVTARLRSPETTIWMSERNLRASSRSFHEEVAPCPDCHHVEVEYFRHGDKVPFRTMDPASVRQALL